MYVDSKISHRNVNFNVHAINRRNLHFISQASIAFVVLKMCLC